MVTQIQRSTEVSCYDEALAVLVAVLGYIHLVVNKNSLSIYHM